MTFIFAWLRQFFHHIIFGTIYKIKAKKMAKMANHIMKNVISFHTWKVYMKGQGECRTKFIVKCHDWQTGQNLDPTTATSRTKSGIICVKEAVKLKKKVNMAPWHMITPWQSVTWSIFQKSGFFAFIKFSTSNMEILNLVLSEALHSR